MRSWFARGGENDGGPEDGGGASGSSLLSDWISYAKPSNNAEGGSKLDVESAVRFANESLSSTFSVVSKGVRELPGTLQSATSSLPSGKSLMYFGIFLASGVFFIFIAFVLFLPVIVLLPQKFAICFTLGCCFVIGSFFALNGFRSQLSHMASKERLPFTAAFLGSMIGTLCASMVLHSYVLSLVFSVIQVVALVYYVVTYFPGGSTGMKLLSSSILSSATRCFGS